MADGKVFFIADTHFGHEAIIAYENRPFANAEEMDKALVQNWNGRVSKNDTVFLLGDFSLCESEKNEKICRSLNGNKILVMGNHDSKSEQYYRDCGFRSVSRYPIIYEGFWILSHEPMYVNSNMPYANIFGHVHANPEYSDFSVQSFCVSAERIAYAPIEFGEIKEKMGVAGQ